MILNLVNSIGFELRIVSDVENQSTNFLVAMAYQIDPHRWKDRPVTSENLILVLGAPVHADANGKQKT